MPYRIELIDKILDNVHGFIEFTAVEKELLELRRAVAKAELDPGEKAERLRLARKLNALLLAKVRRG